MPQRHVVVDGSNIATEGRSLPSLAQLDQAVREFLGEFPDDIVTVVVDASFAHRIDPSEVGTFEEAEAAGEVVSPPAGAIGRGDAFLLRIADKTGATVLSNDSFQEFHGEHEWLFDPDRLVGGKPVPGVGWIFTPRTPVRGPKSREAVKEAKRKKRAESDDGTASGLDLAASRGRGRGKKVERAIATATEEAVEPSDTKKRRRRKNSEPPSDPINEPLAFITFIAGHPLGSEVEGTVESFASHGAFVEADGARCYVPLSAMGDPAPRSAREVMSRGETRPFVIQALDPLRRGIELALPGFAKLSGAPTEETVEAETHSVAGEQAEPSPGAAAAPATRAAARRRPAVAPPLAEGEDRGDRPAIGASKAAPPVRRRSGAPVAAAGTAPPAETPPAEMPPAPAARAGKARAPEPVTAEAVPAGEAAKVNGALGPEPARKPAATGRRTRKAAPPGAEPVADAPELGPKATAGKVAGAPKKAASAGARAKAVATDSAPKKAATTKASTTKATTGTKAPKTTKAATKATKSTKATKATKATTKEAKASKTATTATKATKVTTKATKAAIKKAAAKATEVSKAATKATKATAEKVTPQRSGRTRKASAKTAGGSGAGEPS
jgi:hypothetical protein